MWKRLDDAPEGISVWEGHAVGYPQGIDGDYPDPDPDLVGTFRAPTDAEWAAIRENKSPWPKEPCKKCEGSGLFIGAEGPPCLRCDGTGEEPPGNQPFYVVEAKS